MGHHGRTGVVEEVEEREELVVDMKGCRWQHLTVRVFCSCTGSWVFWKRSCRCESGEGGWWVEGFISPRGDIVTSPMLLTPQALSGGLESTSRPGGHQPPADTHWRASKVALFCCHVWTDGSLMLQGCYVVICSFWLYVWDKPVWIVITSGKHFRTCSKCHHVKTQLHYVRRFGILSFSCQCCDTSFILSIFVAVIVSISGHLSVIFRAKVLSDCTAGTVIQFWQTYSFQSNLLSFCFAHFLANSTPSLFLSHIFSQSLPPWLPFWFSIRIFSPPYLKPVFFVCI